MNSRSQTKFQLGHEFKERLEFGGSLMKSSKYRSVRPVSTRESMHLILKSTKAVGVHSFGYRANPKIIKQIVDRHCAKYAVKLISYSNNFNHLHFHLKFGSRVLYLKFVRSLTASIAMAVTGAAKLRNLKTLIGKKGFFDYRPFTRVVRGLRAFKTLQNYIRLNQLEAQGVIPKRDGRLKDVRPHEKKYFEGW